MSIWQWFVLVHQDYRLHGSLWYWVRMLHDFEATTVASVAGVHYASPAPSLFTACPFACFFQLSTNLSLQVWLATLLSFVIVTVTYALLTRQEGWGKDPRFGFVDSECSLPIISLTCKMWLMNCTSPYWYDLPMFHYRLHDDSKYHDLQLSFLGHWSTSLNTVFQNWKAQAFASSPPSGWHAFSPSRFKITQISMSS